MGTSLWHTIHLAKNAFYKTFFFGHQTYPIKFKLLHLGYNRDVLYAPKIGMKWDWLLAYVFKELVDFCA